jgi:hypothetical protein
MEIGFTPATVYFIPPRNPTHPKRIRMRENAYAVETDSHPFTRLHHVRSANAATEDARRAATRRASAGTVRDRDAEICTESFARSAFSCARGGGAKMRNLRQLSRLKAGLRLKAWVTYTMTSSAVVGRPSSGFFGRPQGQLPRDFFCGAVGDRPFSLRA